MREKREAIMNRIVDDANQMVDQIMTTDQFGYKTYQIPVVAGDIGGRGYQWGYIGGLSYHTYQWWG